MHWTSLASSFDGHLLVAGAESGGLYISSDAGTNWTQTSAPVTYWGDIACSADGTKLVALGYLKVYRSTDSGATWITNSAPTASMWGGVASSEDGTKLVAVATYGSSSQPGPIYVSADSGVTWTTTSAPSNFWWAVASSADGSRLLAAGGYHLYLSTNSGADWTVTSAPETGWFAVASSGDGRVLAGVSSGVLEVSTNWGVDWKWAAAFGGLSRVAIDKSGRALMAFGSDQVHASPDSGTTWVPTEPPAGYWRGATASGDGSKWLGASSSDRIYLAQINAPMFVVQPADQEVAAGLDAAFTPSLLGAEPRSYQWTFGGTNLAGATESSLILTNVNATAAGQYAVVVSNRYGSTWSSNAGLSVVSAKVTTLPAGAISATNVSLLADVTVGIEPSALWFDFGPDTNYGNRTSSSSVSKGHHWVGIAVDGLDGETVYHCQAVVSNAVGIVYGGDETFQMGLAPSASTLNPAEVTTNGATLLTTVNPRGRQTVAYFTWGTGSGETNMSPGIFVGQGATGVNISHPITGLQPFAVYHYSAWASNSAGTSKGKYVYFSTGPWFPTEAPDLAWKAVACSADGRLWAAAVEGGGIYTSTNRGANWASNNAPAARWTCITSSADGNKLAAASGETSGFIGRGRVYTSTDSGATWVTSSAPAAAWSSIACSADGTRLVAANSQALMGLIGVIYTSTNSGATWVSNNAAWTSCGSVASSADGTKLIAAAAEGRIYISTNSGSTWCAADLPRTNWCTVASSADGGTLVAAGGGGETRNPLFMSTNSGTTWMVSSLPPKGWVSVACSADGDTLLAVSYATPPGGGLCVSTNRGVTWRTNLALNLRWAAGTSSADGKTLLAVAMGVETVGQIYAIQTLPSPRLRFTGQQGGATISWLIPSVDFGLQAAADLPGGHWAEVLAPPDLDLSTLRYQVTVPATNGASFYRLRKR